MEKYRKFADAKYGINPFLPIKPKNTSKALKYTLGPILLILRLPFVLLTLGMLYLYKNFLSRLVVVKALRLSIERSLYKILGFLVGLTDYKHIPKFTAKDANRPKLEAGHIVLCNHTHPLDFLYFAQTCNASFVQLSLRATSSGEKETFLTPLDFGSMLKYFLGSGRTAPLTDNASHPDFRYKLSDIVDTSFKTKEGPVVIFFEGAITNGKGVLEMHESLAYDIYEYQKLNNRENVVAALTFADNADASVAHPILSTLSLMMNLSTKVTVRLCSISKMPIQKKDMPRTIYDLYENIHELPKMALRYEDYQGFLQYWRATQKKNYVAKKDL